MSDSDKSTCAPAAHDKADTATATDRPVSDERIFNSERPIRVLIVDDQELVRAGFKVILNAQSDIAVMGEAANGAEAVELAEILKPDVVLMDIRMPLMDGLEATEKLRELCPETHIIILTTFDLDEYVYRALKLGAAGFLLKDAEPRLLIDAVRVVAHDEALLSPTVTRRLIERFAAGQLCEADEEAAAAGAGDDVGYSAHMQSLMDALTPREHEIWRLVACGLSNDEIARELFISGATVKTHLNRTMMKLDVHDRAALVVLAYEYGIATVG